MYAASLANGDLSVSRRRQRRRMPRKRCRREGREATVSCRHLRRRSFCRRSASLAAAKPVRLRYSAGAICGSFRRVSLQENRVYPLDAPRARPNPGVVRSPRRTARSPALAEPVRRSCSFTCKEKARRSSLLPCRGISPAMPTASMVKISAGSRPWLACTSADAGSRRPVVICRRRLPLRREAGALSKALAGRRRA